MGKVFFIRKNQEDILKEHRDILEDVRKVQVELLGKPSSERVVERFVDRPVNVVEQEAVARVEVSSVPETEPLFIPKAERAQVSLSVETTSEESENVQESAAKLRKRRKKDSSDEPTL